MIYRLEDYIPINMAVRMLVFFPDDLIHSSTTFDGFISLATDVVNDSPATETALMLRYGYALSVRDALSKEIDKVISNQTDGLKVKLNGEAYDVQIESLLYWAKVELLITNPAFSEHYWPNTKKHKFSNNLLIVMDALIQEFWAIDADKIDPEELKKSRSAKFMTEWMKVNYGHFGELTDNMLKAICTIVRSGDDDSKYE